MPRSLQKCGHSPGKPDHSLLLGRMACPSSSHTGAGMYERRGLLSAVVDDAGDFSAEVGAADDAVDESVFEHELGCLKALRQFRPDRVADDAGAGESDHGPRFGQDDVAQ